MPAVITQFYVTRWQGCPTPATTGAGTLLGHRQHDLMNIRGNFLGHIVQSSTEGTDGLFGRSIITADNDISFAQTQHSCHLWGSNVGWSSATATVVIGQKMMVHGNLGYYTYSLANLMGKNKKRMAWRKINVLAFVRAGGGRTPSEMRQQGKPQECLSVFLLSTTARGTKYGESIMFEQPRTRWRPFS